MEKEEFEIGSGDDGCPSCVEDENEIITLAEANMLCAANGCPCGCHRDFETVV